MRFEIIVILITIFFVFNIYTEGKLLKTASWKIYQMIGVLRFIYSGCLEEILIEPKILLIHLMNI